jgi:hypothetical protein
MAGQQEMDRVLFDIFFFQYGTVSVTTEFLALVGCIFGTERYRIQFSSYRDQECNFQFLQSGPGFVYGTVRYRI